MSAIVPISPIPITIRPATMDDLPFIDQLQKKHTKQVGFLHTQALNGCAVRAPSGGKVILMDKGVLLHMQLLGRCILALTTWSAPAPYCRDHPPVAWFDAIVKLAQFANSMDPRFLQAITVWHCPSLEPWDLQSAKFATQVEVFVLLHEYGHVALGHLDPKRVATRGRFVVFQTDPAQEIEADAFGMQRMIEAAEAGAAALVAASFLRFVDLMEHLAHGGPVATATHPAARERLARIKQSTGLDAEAHAVIAQIESLFDVALRATRPSGQQ